MALRVNDDNYETEVLQSVLPVLAEFYSDSCIPCKQLAVVLSELEEEMENQVKIVKVNVNFCPELAERYRVMASPTILFYKDGKELHRITGLVKKAELKQLIDLQFSPLPEGAEA